MQTSDLLQALDARAHLLLAASENPDDGLTDMGLVLLALNRLLARASSTEPAATGQPAATAFKAKSNRW